MNQPVVDRDASLQSPAAQEDHDSSSGPHHRASHSQNVPTSRTSETTGGRPDGLVFSMAAPYDQSVTGLVHHKKTPRSDGGIRTPPSSSELDLAGTLRNLAARSTSANMEQQNVDSVSARRNISQAGSQSPGQVPTIPLLKLSQQNAMKGGTSVPQHTGQTSQGAPSPGNINFQPNGGSGNNAGVELVGDGSTSAGQHASSTGTPWQGVPPSTNDDMRQRLQQLEYAVVLMRQQLANPENTDMNSPPSQAQTSITAPTSPTEDANESRSTEVLMPGQRQDGINISGNADTVSPDTRSSEARENESLVQDTRYSEAHGRDQVPSPRTSSTKYIKEKEKVYGGGGGEVKGGILGPPCLFRPRRRPKAPLSSTLQTPLTSPPFGAKLAKKILEERVGENFCSIFDFSTIYREKRAIYRQKSREEGRFSSRIYYYPTG